MRTSFGDKFAKGFQEKQAFDLNDRRGPADMTDNKHGICWPANNDTTLSLARHASKAPESIFEIGNPSAGEAFSTGLLDSSERDASSTSVFFTLPLELRREVYEWLAVGTVLKRRAMYSANELKNSHDPSVLLVSKRIRAEYIAVANKRVPLFLDLPINVKYCYMPKWTCPKLDIAFPRSLGQGSIVLPTKRLFLRVAPCMPDAWWQDTLWPLYIKKHINTLSCEWLPQLLERIKGCTNLEDLSIRWCLPWAELETTPKARELHSMFDSLVAIAESLPSVKRYSVQIGFCSPHVSEVPRWGLAALSTYGRRGKWKEWQDDESTVRYCCQALPYGEWRDFLDSMCPLDMS